MAISTMRKDLVFPKAGHFMLVPHDASGVPDFAKAYSSFKGIVTSIGRDNAVNTVDLPDGNSVYAAATYPQTYSGTLTIGMSTYDPELEAVLSGSKYEESDETTTKPMWANKSISLESGVSYTFGEDEDAPTNAENMVVQDIFGNRMTLSDDEASVEDGKFYYDSTTKTLTFPANAIGKTLFVTYVYEGHNVAEVAYSETPKVTSFMAVIIGETMDKDMSSRQRTNVIIDRCGVSGSITPPTASNDPTQGWTMTINVLKPRAGHEPIVVRFENMK